MLRWFFCFLCVNGLLAGCSLFCLVYVGLVCYRCLVVGDLLLPASVYLVFIVFLGVCLFVCVGCCLWFIVVCFSCLV